MDRHARLLEAILLARPGTLSWSEAASLIGCKKEEARAVAESLAAARTGHGVVLIQSEDGCMLATAPDLADAMAEIEIRERSTPLSKAQMETLATVLYHGSPAKGEVDDIRGVNSVHALRALVSRGLVAKVGDGRNVRYVVTPEALAHLGITDAASAQDFVSIHDQLTGAAPKSE